MKKQLQNYVPQFAKCMAVFAVVAAIAIPAKAVEPAGFTFKLDQHDSVLNDQATLAVLVAAIESGLVDPNDPAVAYELQRAQLQQDLSSYNAMCTLIPSALALRTSPTISIGNGLELTTPDSLDFNSSKQNIIGFKIELGSTKNGYDFGLLKSNNMAALPMVVPNNTDVTSIIQDNGNTLVISFDNGGLLPGQMATMKIQLLKENAGPTTPWPSMTEFFSEDSLLTVVFQDPDTLDVTQTDPFPFADFMQHVTMWQQQLATPLQHIHGVVDSYMIGGTLEPNIVPEPSSIALALGSLSGYFLLGRRRVA